MSAPETLINLANWPQKLLVGGLGAALVAAGTYNVIQTVENRRLVSSNEKLATSITDPKTGFVVRLTQAESNSQTCRSAISRQNAAIRVQATKDADTIAAVQARYDLEHAARVRAEKAAAAFLAQKPRGATLTERVSDVDARILGELR